MSEGISKRGLQLLELASLKELAQNGSTAYVRWQNIKRGKARIGADEIEILGRVFPRYRSWLITGEVLLEIQQVSPEHDQKYICPPFHSTRSAGGGGCGRRDVGD